MKNVKKLLGILLVLTLVLSLGATAFAATVEITPLAGDTVNHKYEVYQVFTGSQVDEPDNSPLGNVEWGTGIDEVGFLAALKADPDVGTVFAGCTTARDVAEALAANTDIADKFAEIAAAHTATVTTTLYSIPGEGQSSKTTVDDGYYLIIDKTSVDGQDTSRNETMLQLTGEVSITAKYDIPSSEKKVKDINDTNEAAVGTTWQDSADWDIGDHVPFQLTATIPAKTTVAYETYTLTFHDQEGPGLAFESGSVKVYLNGVEVTDTTKYTVNTSTSDGDTFDVVFTDIKSLTGFDPEAANTITVEYTSVLDTNAVIGPDGNPNTMKLEFSNDSTSDGTGMTPEDKVIVFTYDMDVNKVDGENNPLPGAEFALYKVVADETQGMPASEVDQLKDVEELKDKFVKKLDITKQSDNVTFYSKGIDDGEYWVVEMTTPDGYNTAEPQQLVVEATHTDGKTPALESVTDTNGVLKFTVKAGTAGDAMGQMDVVNQSGVTLPETGGIGTTIFYVVGAVLVAGAVIILVTKKRMAGTEK